ncbi:MAG: hypothetical protein WC876_04690 [Candidatus Thermoplasmatota archaeon]|jgi:hypothetical protein
MRVAFNEVFTVNGDGGISPKGTVVVGGVQLNPGMDFGRRVRLGTIHFAAVAGRDLEVDYQAGVTYLLRPYVPPTRDAPAPLPPMANAMATEPLPMEAVP